MLRRGWKIPRQDQLVDGRVVVLGLHLDPLLNQFSFLNALAKQVNPLVLVFLSIIPDYCQRFCQSDRNCEC